MPTCSACHAPIIWIKTTAGKAMPCDAKKTVVVTPNGEVVTGHISHFATCPQAEEFRREKGR